MRQIIKLDGKAFFRFVSLFVLAFLLVLSKVNAAVGDLFTSGQLKYTVYSVDEKAKTRTVSVEAVSTEITGNIEIPGSIENEGYTYSVTLLPIPAFQCSQLTGIVTPGSITPIGEFVFGDCSSLTDIVISDRVTSLGGRAFSDCGLTNVYCIKF